VNFARLRALECMQPTTTTDYVDDFVWEVLRTGVMLTDLLADLIESMPEDAYPGEDNARVVVEMLAGTVRPVVEGAGEQIVRRATALLSEAAERTLSDLRLSLELARLRESDPSPGPGDQQSN
jgi:hypothetical protein